MEEKIEVVEAKQQTNNVNKKKKKKVSGIIRAIVYIVAIAIIAAIIIPSYKKLQKNILIKEDVAMARDLNVGLEEYEKEEKIENYEDAIAAMKQRGYIFKGLEATVEGCYFVWEKDTNQILLVEKDEESFKVLYSEKDGYGEYDDSWYFAIEVK